ncbi:hypothetical protein [Pyrodictium abyssi]|uniref:CHAD domain-containing protein n=1 Tax=Pyrodictium abyssi TaxID=54256 RepID=A0ABN6ZQ37_9CREN|nr:hypothetical protein PABY_19280 [Pyrodictium abyssi]
MPQRSPEHEKQDPFELLIKSYALVPLSGERDSRGQPGRWSQELSELIMKVTGARSKQSLWNEIEKHLERIDAAVEARAPSIGDMRLLHCSTVVLALQTLVAYRPGVRLWVGLAAYAAAQTLHHALQARSQQLPGVKELAEALKAEVLRITGRRVEPKAGTGAPASFYEALAEATWRVVQAEQEFADSLGAALLTPAPTRARALTRNIDRAYRELARLVDGYRQGRGGDSISPHARIKCRVRLASLTRYANTCRKLHSQLARLVEALSHEDTLEAVNLADQLTSQGYGLLAPQLGRLLETIRHTEAAALEYAVTAALIAQGYRPLPHHRGKGAQREEIDFLGCKATETHKCAEALALEAKLTLKQGHDPCKIAAETLQKLQNHSALDPKPEKLRLVVTWLGAQKEQPKTQTLTVRCTSPTQDNTIECSQDDGKNREELLDAVTELCRQHSLKEVTIELVHAYSLVSSYCSQAMILKHNDCNKWKKTIQKQAPKTKRRNTRKTLQDQQESPASTPPGAGSREAPPTAQRDTRHQKKQQ